jgi:Spy/CpxP family protein refolding chaperone
MKRTPAPEAGTHVYIERDERLRMKQPLGKWWKNSEYVKELGVTPQQVNTLEKIFMDHRLNLIDLRADLERQETQLEPLIEADQPDEAKVGAQIDAIAAARGRLEKANTLMMLAIRKTLSVEQWKKLQEMPRARAIRIVPGGASELLFEERVPGPPVKTRRPSIDEML